MTADTIDPFDPTAPVPDPAPWTITLPGDDRVLRFEVADPEGHAELMHDWMHQPHVAPWWGADRDREGTVAYLRRQRASGHLVPWIVSHATLGPQAGAGLDVAAPDDEAGPWTPFGFTELYRAAEDPLADHFPLTAADRGWHVLVGPPQTLGGGLPRLLGRAVLARLLASPGVDRVVCEPNEDNGRMLAFCRALGYESLGPVDLPDKRAVLMACTVDAFDARWPGDRKAAS
ncbi:MAG TPA: GNAT family N-acetyltransferase [Acidimicrobiales bacterium]|jgi:RimJ/RimL family protein N-acetyltransferase|nr:GNAT family N-acetyltransferase [Acidimicrobiales bacterium]